MTRYEPLSIDADAVSPRAIHWATLPDGLRLPYVVQGRADGLPLILLHGYTDSWRSFEPLLPLLPDTLRVYALTQRGHGDADRPDQGYATADFVADLGAFMECIGVRRALLFGHSMGAAHALAFAAANPERVSGLMLEAAFASFCDNPVLADFLQQVVAALQDPIHPGFVRDFQLGTLAQPIAEQALDQFIADSLKLPARVWRAVGTGFMADAALHALPRVQAPVRLLWGARDALVAREDQTRLLQGLQSASLCIYDDGGHALHWEQPARVAADLIAFAQECAS